MEKRIFDVEIRLDSASMAELESEYDNNIKEYLANGIDGEGVEVISAGEIRKIEEYFFVSAVVSTLGHKNGWWILCMSERQ